MLILHEGKNFVTQFPTAICIIKADSDFRIRNEDGSSYTVNYFTVSSNGMKYPNELITHLVGTSPKADVHISQEAYEMVMLACETNRLLY